MYVVLYQLSRIPFAYRQGSSYKCEGQNLNIYIWVPLIGVRFHIEYYSHIWAMIILFLLYYDIITKCSLLKSDTELSNDHFVGISEVLPNTRYLSLYLLYIHCIICLCDLVMTFSIQSQCRSMLYLHYQWVPFIFKNNTYIEDDVKQILHAFSSNTYHKSQSQSVSFEHLGWKREVDSATLRSILRPLSSLE